MFWLLRSPITIILLICTLTIYALFSIKESVAGMTYELSELNRQIQTELDTIHLLKAEFAYLSSPARLKELNDSHLHLEPIVLAQVVRDPVLDNGEEARLTMLAELKDAEQFVRQAKQIKWRYKRSASKYLAMASCKGSSCKVSKAKN